MSLTTSARANIVADPSLVFDVANGLVEEVDPATVFRAWGPFPGTERIEVLGSGELGIGATRRIHLLDNSAIEETILAYNPGSAWSYRLTGLPAPFAYMVSDARASWTLEPDAGTVRTTWVYSFELSSVLFWPIAYFVVNVLFVRMMRSTLAHLANACIRASNRAAA